MLKAVCTCKTGKYRFKECILAIGAPTAVQIAAGWVDTFSKFKMEIELNPE